MKRVLRVTLPVVIKHRIIDRSDLSDTACTKSHIHKNAKVTVEVKEGREEFIDFKTIKYDLMDVLGICTEGESIDVNKLMEFEDATVEIFAAYIHKKMVIALSKSQYDIIVDIQETAKYGYRLEYEKYD